jgi:hypothetical protein
MNDKTNISQSLTFLRETIDRRLRHYFGKENGQPFELPEVELAAEYSPLYHFLKTFEVNIEEFVILLLGLTPHIQPNLIDSVIQQYLPNGGEFQEIGGVKSGNHRGTIPTGETALFILAGNDIPRRMQCLHYFSGDHYFARQNILQLENLKDGEPRMSGRIILQPDYLEVFTTGNISKPAFTPDFPAKLITTKMEWTDLVLNPKTATAIDDIRTWLHHNETFMMHWGMEKKIKKGFRTLFYGPPGTGKTLTATLLGKQFEKDVYRIDLSQIVSKYIGETEKNLEKVFSKAENKDWILFFDEADALFGKRSNVQSAHDRYANQEVSYLLQRVEDFDGLIILASNFKSNMDAAFIRRFNSIINFPMPTVSERQQIWQTSIPPVASVADDVDILNLANKYELSGSGIVNVVHYASLQTIYKKSTTLSKDDILRGIRQEYEKEERVFN